MEKHYIRAVPIFCASMVPPVIGVAGLSAYQLIYYTPYQVAIGALAGLSIAAAILALLIAILVQKPVRIDHDAIHYLDNWARPARVPWSAIEQCEARRALGLSYVRILPDPRYRPILLPLFLRNAVAFTQSVTSLAGPDNPLSRELQAAAQHLSGPRSQ
jgi:hypothetical protein